MSIHIDNLYYIPDYTVTLAYFINNTVYGAEDLANYAFDEEEIEVVLDGLPTSFDLDLNSSKPIAIQLRSNRSNSTFVLIYQEVNGQLINLRPRPDRYNEVVSINILKVPLPGGQDVNDIFQELNLRDPTEESMIELRDDLIDHREVGGRTLSPSFPRIGSRSPSPVPRWRTPSPRRLSIPEWTPAPDYEALANQLIDLSSKYESLLLSHEALIKQVYGIPVETPQFLILNSLKVNFIPFSQVSTIQIERWVIDPMLQVWASPPNKIITIFGKNGITYLVKARYDQALGQIFQP